MLGHTVTHRFRTTGWYRLTVDYYWPAHHQWVEFDSAEEHIVPPSALLWTNFSYYANDAVNTALRVLIWGALVVVAGFLVLSRLPPSMLSRFPHRQRPAKE